MASDWKEVILDDVLMMSKAKIDSKDIDIENYISTGNMLPDFGGVTIADKLPSVSKFTSYQAEDILFSNIRTYFRKLWIANKDGGCSNDVIVFKAREGINPSFGFYSLMNEEFIQYTVQTSKGTKMPRGDKEAMKNYPLSIPPLSEQEAIAHILGSLDDKIELNRQMNETLEAMAQALFKSWFVDFDPVLDNALAAGKPIPDEFMERAEQRKGIEKKENSDIQSLFPDEFEFTEEMGWIPKGWEVKNLTEIADFQNGFAFYTTGYSESGYKVVDLANIHTDGRFIETHRDKHVSSEVYNLPKHEKHHLYKDDIVMAMTDITQAMGILGKCGKIYESNKYILNQRIGRIRVEKGINVNFLLTYLNSTYQLSFLKTRSLGTVQKYVNTTHITDMNFVVPQNEVMNKFGDMVDPQFNKIRELDEANVTLAKLRDTLLPKLTSGELRIPDAEALVDEAV